MIRPDLYELLWIRVRQRTKHDRPQDAEDGRVRADADREREKRHDREARRAPQPAHSHYQISTQLAEAVATQPLADRRGVNRLNLTLDRLAVAERLERRAAGVLR